ncbi:MAG: hypothetical protein LBH12_04665 [Dysgonamonadaceae bacterium]|jgi:hypothetical protein|nr:hypothetical protein [Dysgonamonadaceae bacterium]
MRKYGFAFLAVIILFLSCSSDKKEALLLIEKARNLYEKKEYGSAKLTLDELKTTYPKESALRKEALDLVRDIETEEQKRNIVFCDSMIIVCQSEVDSMKNLFLFEKTAYDPIGKYIDKTYNPQPGHASKYIKIYVTESGDLVLNSVYRGNPIKHNRIKVSVPSGEYKETESIPFDGGNNYSFTDLGVTYETVTYQKGRDNGVIRFIYHFADQKISLEYSGAKKTSPYILSEKEKKALVNTVNLASALKDTEQFKNEKEKAEKRLEYLENKKDG